MRAQVIELASTSDTVAPPLAGEEVITVHGGHAAVRRARSADPAARGTAPPKPALLADGNRARIDGIVSLAVVASAAVVALGLQVADALIGRTITLVVLRLTWQSFTTIRVDRDGPAGDAS
jgi:hypothetical protein